MKKTILLLLCIFCVAGCTATYEMEYYNDEFRENIKVDNPNLLEDKLSQLEIPSYYDETAVSDLVSFRVEDVRYYAKSIEDGKYIYINKFKTEEYYRSYFANATYDYFAVLYDDYDPEVDEKMVTISTNDVVKIFEKYPELDDIKIVLKTNHKVKSHNADETSGDEYIWRLNKNDHEKTIFFKVYKEKYNWNYNNILVKTLVLIAGIIFLIGLIALMLWSRSKKMNKI